jgi:predicted bacteriocin transport accessory protein
MMNLKKILALLLCMFILCGCSYKSYIVDTTLDEVKEKIENKEDFILYIGSKTCSHCAQYRPKLEDVANEYEITVYYVDVSTLSTEEENELKNIANYTGTPTTAFIYDGEDLGTQTHIDGDVSIEKIKQAFKNNGYIK